MFKKTSVTPINYSRRIFAAAIAATSVLTSGLTFAQTGTYPSKPIKLVVGYTAGGATDIMARTVAQYLSDRLGQPVVVENRTGAGASIAVSFVTSAPPDGYTLLFTTAGPLFITPRGEPLKELTAVGLAGNMPLVLVVPANSPANNLSELLALAKGKPGKMTYSSVGTGGMTHIGMEMLKHVAGVDIMQVRYKGQAAATPDLIAGRIDMLLDGWAPSMQNVDSGKLKYLAVVTPNRSAVRPSVPTVAEQGFPGFDASQWFGIFAPAHTPKSIIKNLSDALVEITNSQEFKNKFKDLGFDAMTASSDEFSKFVDSERMRLTKVLKDANIKLD